MEMGFKYCALILVIFLNHVYDASCQDEKCKAQGVVCTPDCSGIVACVETGADPIPLHTCDSTDKTLFCQVNEGVATCDAASCSGSGGGSDINIICGSIGELPHPTNCGASVRCTSVGETANPDEECKCPANAFVDIMRPSLPCRSGGCPRKPVVCDAAGKFGKIQEGSDFYYICGKEEENSVVVFLSDDDVTRNLMPDFRASIPKDCEEYVPPTEETPTEE